MAARTTTLGANGTGQFDDGVMVGPELSRWQKAGHDRLYPAVGDGYIDLKAGKVVDLSFHYESGIGDVRMDVDGDVINLMADHRQHGEIQIATIPAEMFL